MANLVARRINGALGRLLPDRRIFIRSDDRTRYLHISPLSQLGAAALVVAGLGWGGYATVALVSRTVEAERAAQDHAALERAVAARLAELEAERDAALAELAAREDARASLGARLGEAQERLVETVAELRASHRARAALQRRLSGLEEAQAAATARIAGLTAELRDTQMGLLAGAGPLVQAAPLARRASVADSVPGMMLSGTIGTVIEERDAALGRVAELDRQVTELNAEIEGWKDRQEVILTRLETAARTGLEGLTTMLERADIDVERILAETRADYSGTGGPFEPITDEEAALIDEESDVRIAALMTDLERTALLRIATERLPFAKPVISARMTSGFGKRRDPIRKRWSMHSGIDFAGPRGTGILATASGVVSFSGRMSGYGNVVVVTHAFGYETRYAHLNRALVKVGERVERGQKIAEMGSTGRSTGTHLHYEIRIDGDPINPRKFIEAARDVL